MRRLREEEGSPGSKPEGAGPAASVAADLVLVAGVAMD